MLGITVCGAGRYVLYTTGIRARVQQDATTIVNTAAHGEAFMLTWMLSLGPAACRREEVC